ncbi:hypothetical protein QCA50_002339 [Cerrena zonata]|uniref:Small nuclear ribonucleoprotein Prp3 C-terminal domain-containing protein n=1 Tax=Cerrena zonata TaxID=2478898 RepID=A0AAW0GVC1_9APHY
MERQLEELNLLKHSLLNGEKLLFTDNADTWNSLLESHSDLSFSGNSPSQASKTDDLSPAKFRITAQGSPIQFEVTIPCEYNGSELSVDLSQCVSVRGDQISRTAQERWQNIVVECAAELSGSEYPIYELISVHLLPRLHEEISSDESEALAIRDSENDVVTSGRSHEDSSSYHALLTSHHLVSPTKRRNMQHWSSQLSISGFAKVGYPGVIYCQGDREQVEEFVANIRAMQWLALKLRFMEPIPENEVPKKQEKRRWVEFEKVGEVVEEMRQLGREAYITEMGIGSTGNAATK